VRRAIIFAIVVSMATLATTPVPACELFSSQVAECKAAQTQMQCDGMDMQMNVQDDVPHLSPPCQNACCMTSQVFRPEAQSKSDETLVLIARANANTDANTVFIPKESIPVFHWEKISPSGIQSLLCTFLI
jgi:hypothetical protein